MSRKKTCIYTGRHNIQINRKTGCIFRFRQTRCADREADSANRKKDRVDVLNRKADTTCIYPGRQNKPEACRQAD